MDKSSAAASAPQGPWYWGFNVFAVGMAITAVANGVTIASFGLFAERWVAEFNVPRSQLMLAVTAGTLFMGAASPIAGRAMDVGSARKVIGVGLAAFILSLVALCFATRPWHIIALYAIAMPAGVTVAGSVPLQVLTARWFTRRRGFAIGVATCATSTGGILLPPVVAWSLLEFGWRQTFAATAVLAVVVLAPAAAFLVRDRPDKVVEDRGSGKPAASGRTYTIGQILKERNFWILLGIFVVFFLAGSGFASNAFRYATLKGLTTAQATGLLSTFFFIQIPGRFGWGYLADHFDHRLLLAAAVAGAATGLLALGFVTGVWGVYAATLLFGAGFCGFFPLISAALARQFTASYGRAAGLVGMGLPISAVGAPLVAALQERLGNYESVMMLLAGLIVCCGLPLVLFRPGGRTGAPAPAG